MSDAPQPGDLIGGKYRVVSVLGEGGMGVVLEVHHERLDQRMAVKMMRPEFARAPDFVRRFAREARAAARLRSPHAVKVFDVDEMADGRAYMVMELLEGRDLDAELATHGGVPVAQLVDWMLQVCAAIAEAHAAGIIHRDLKPANIFLSHGPGRGDRIAKVLDFGISRYNKLGEGTTTDQAIGTPHYMSPEQVRSSRGLDGRSDVWAIGVILYHALTGRFPFPGETATAVAVAIATEPPLPIMEARPDLPPALVSAIVTALEKNPDDRFSTVEELAAAIAPFGTGRMPRSLVSSALHATTPSLGTGPAPSAPVHVRASVEPPPASPAPDPRLGVDKTLRARGVPESVPEKDVTAASGVASAASDTRPRRGLRAWHFGIGVAALALVSLAAVRILAGHPPAAQQLAPPSTTAVAALPTIVPQAPVPSLSVAETPAPPASTAVAPSASSASSTPAATGRPHAPSSQPTRAPTSTATQAPPPSATSRTPLHL